MPTFAVHIPDDAPYLPELEKRRASRDVSSYIRDVFEQGLAAIAAADAPPPTADPRFLEKLYATLLPSRVSRFQRLWDVRVKLAQEPATQSEIVEQMLRSYLELLESEPTAKLVDAFDALPGFAENLRALAAPANITPYTQPEEPARHVAEDQPTPPRTLRTLPHKPPKPKSTGTTP